MPRILDALARLMPRRAMTLALGTRARGQVDEKASRTGPLIALQTLGRPVWTPRDYAAFAREGFMQNAICYRSVRMIAEAAASIPLLLYEGGEEIEEHPLLDLIRRPSADHTGADFFEAWYGFLLVAGNAYVEAVGVGGRVRELHALRPDRMKVVPGADGWPEAFEYTAGGDTVRFAGEVVAGVRPVLHVKLFHPVNDHYGMSPIEAAATAIDIHNTAAKWNKALLDNSARPSGALVYSGRDGRMSAEQFERLKGELESSYQGARHAGRPLLLEGGLDWKALSLSPKDMDFIEAKHAAAREIALALGVPPMLLGIPGDNTYSNYQEAQRAFWRQTVLPLVNRTAKAFAAWLAPAWGVLPEAGTQRLELRPDLDQVEALTGEREALWSRLNAANFLTTDEKRAAVGYGAIESLGSDASLAPASGRTGLTPLLKYSPDQQSVAAGNSDGGQWTDGGGGGGSTGRIGTDRVGRLRVAQTAERDSYPVDLRAEDADLGGHTISRHVDRPTEELLENVRRDRYVGPIFTIARRAQGSFLSLEDANSFVNRVLEENKEVVAAVARGERSEAEFVKRFGYVTGKEAYRAHVDAEPYVRPTYEVYVHIEADQRSKKGFRVFRSYPMNAKPLNE